MEAPAKGQAKQHACTPKPNLTEAYVPLYSNPSSATTPSTMRELIRRLSFSDRASDGCGVPRGCVPVLVGDGGAERFVVPVEALRHPSFAALLEMAAQEFGYKQEGILRVPCAVHRFKQVLDAASSKN